MPTSDSVDIDQYLEQMAAIVGITLHLDYKPGVKANLERLQAIAQLFLEFPLPDDIDAAPVFYP
ncbi:MAG: DUF4089 domain-containing protein [Cyanobacteria bacterium]|nr:DUF4089 domain-containing protein [Cyanobacteriota bacterium]